MWMLEIYSIQRMKKSKNKDDVLHAVDFFCSAGGVTCGFKQAGINVLGGIDIDPACELTYKKNNDAEYLCADVSNLEKNIIAQKFNIKKNQDNLIFVGCSPCQYYSNIKTDKTKSKETRLLLEDFQDFVNYYRPGYVFIENVPGLDRNPESPLGRFKIFLSKKGYVFDEKVINAKYYEVPQNRRRYVLIATRVKEEIHLPEENRENVKTVLQAIGDDTKYPFIDAGTKDSTPFIHTSANLSEINKKRLFSIPPNGGSRVSWTEDLQLECYKRHDGHTDVYGRMSWDKPAPTITTRFCSLSNGRYGHPEQLRAISLREGATLQSFPENYLFYSNSQGTIAKMIGNAVPPLLAKAIGEVITKNYKNG
jgi:DNA (cytosine-5)-methyltransferase 1